MTDRAALLRGVLESPLDMGPRLVYADWLEEHGTEIPEVGDCVQAELIRIQWALETTTDIYRRSVLEVRQQELLVWMPLILYPSTDGHGLITARWSGGMVEEVCCLWRDWIRKARRICRAWPIRAVRIRRKEPALVIPDEGLHFRWECHHRLREADKVSWRLAPFLDPGAQREKGWVYSTPEEAKADLARAAASYGRSLVGLPPIPIALLVEVR